MKICGKCYENTITSPNIKFTSSKKIKKLLGFDELCVSCEAVLSVKYKTKKK